MALRMPPLANAAAAIKGRGSREQPGSMGAPSLRGMRSTGRVRPRRRVSPRQAPTLRGVDSGRQVRWPALVAARKEGQERRERPTLWPEAGSPADARRPPRQRAPPPPLPRQIHRHGLKLHGSRGVDPLLAEYERWSGDGRGMPTVRCMGLWLPLGRGSLLEGREGAGDVGVGGGSFTQLGRYNSREWCKGYH